MKNIMRILVAFALTLSFCTTAFATSQNTKPNIYGMRSGIVEESENLKFPLSKEKISVIMQAIDRILVKDFVICLGDCDNPSFRKQIVQNATWELVDESDVARKRASRGISTFIDKKTKRKVQIINVNLPSISMDKIEIEIFSQTYSALLGGPHTMIYTILDNERKKTTRTTNTEKRIAQGFWSAGA